MTQRSAIPSHFRLSSANSFETSSTGFSGIGATVGEFAEIVGRGAIHIVENARISAKLRGHKETLTKEKEGKMLTTAALYNLREVISELVEFSGPGYSKRISDFAQDIIINIGELPLWKRMSQEERRGIRVYLLHSCLLRSSGSSGLKFSQACLKKCLLWDLQTFRNREEHRKIVEDLQIFALEKSQASPIESIYKCLLLSLKAQQCEHLLNERESHNILLRLFNSSTVSNLALRMNWYTEALLEFLHMGGWEYLLNKHERIQIIRSLCELIQGTSSTYNRDWGVYFLYEFLQLPSWKFAEELQHEMHGVCYFLLELAQKASPDRKCQAYESLLDFLKLDVVGDPLDKDEKKEVCKELLSRHSMDASMRQWARGIFLEFMELPSWRSVTVKMQKVRRSSSSSSNSAPSVFSITSSSSHGHRKKPSEPSLEELLAATLFTEPYPSTRRAGLGKDKDRGPGDYGSARVSQLRLRKWGADVYFSDLGAAGSTGGSSESLEETEDVMIQPYRLDFDVVSNREKGKEPEVLGSKNLQEWRRRSIKPKDEVLEEEWIEDVGHLVETINYG